MRTASKYPADGSFTKEAQMVIPVHIWGHALRIWLAAVAALYVAFWLQLGGASSAAVTVAILAQPTRGAALAKAVNRIAATFIGAAMSIVIAGLFPGERVGLLAAFILWICICVFVGSYFRGFRAYAAVLSGYTVGIITVVNIDTPQKVFTTMTDRVAAITIGILCVTLINDLFGSPSVWRELDRRMGQTWHDVRDYARDVLGGAKDDSDRAGMLFAAIVGLRDEVDIVAHDMADGRHRAGGARSAMLALVEIVQQVRLVSLLERGDPLAATIRDQCLAALDGDRSEALRFLARLRDDELSRPDATVAAIGQIQQAIRGVEAMTHLEDGLLSLREGSEPARDVRLPHRKEFFFALQNAIRIGIAVSAGALFLVVAGWPASVSALMITANLCALGTTVPNPSKFAVAAILSFALAAPTAGIVHFYLLTDSQDFVRLAIAIAPVIIFGGLFSVNPKIAGIGTTMIVIFMVLLAPSNPQTFNALSFFSQCMFVGFALGVVFLASRLVWPVSELDKQWAIVRATEKTLAESVTGGAYSLQALSIALASRISDYVAAATGKRRSHLLKGLLASNDLSLASAAAYAHLEQSSDNPAIRSKLGPLRRALQSGNSRRLYAGARSVLRHMQAGKAGLHEAQLSAVTDLWSAALVVERERRRIRHFAGRGFVSKGVGRWS
ncbi:FUSC family protein [Bradyrhizobium sp. JYMT SZCCT0428]|uniref:FUSC family protein n=1 Tax=Bradyrhizobium sp. JYMT SZCCT0428 TaxID=2807673 RepID=UPI001BA59F46|nr:FUSC family protein [Bradyrhizobium sp. JYMT SZCCT0428]MBR1153984.1 FUSC family protein [Bradyrhizobium sp. JYMT SZCCT0428]